MSDVVDPLTPALAAEEEAWAQVLAAWADEGAHQAYLGRFHDLDGLAQAGARYRAVLAERPEDAMALRMRAELVKRATVLGLAALPRTRPDEKPLWFKRAMMLLALCLG